jgi:EAL domain-containing protein (putative c-di-GMP-specific phosphodiesterase class I)
MGDLYFDFAALVIICLNLFIFYYRKYPANYPTRLFKTIIFVSLISVVFDISGVLINVNAAVVPLFLLMLINTLYYIFQNCIPALAMLYIFSLTGWGYTLKPSRLILLLLPWAATEMLILANIFSGVLFSFDASHRYTHGVALFLVYLSAFWYAGLIVLCVFRFKRILDRRTRFAIYGFIVISASAILVQFLMPLALVQCLGIALSQLLVLLTIQNPDEYVDKTTGFLNRAGFIYQTGLYAVNRISFHTLLIVVRNIQFLRNYFGLNFYARLMKEIAIWLQLQQHFSYLSTWLGEGQFSFSLESKTEDEEASRIFSIVRERFRRPWQIEGNSVNLSVRLCRVHFLKEISDVNDFFHCLDTLARPVSGLQNGILLKLDNLGLPDRQQEARISLAVRRGLSEQRFSLYYQPIVSASSLEPISAEALSRLFDTQEGPISPEEFIPLMERSGEIVALSSLVLREAAGFFAAQDLASYGMKHIEVNLSVVDCLQADMAERVQLIVADCGLRPEQICLEITETAAANSTQLLAKNMKTLADKGFLFALDDFGSGFSNINYLMDLPFRMVKIDKKLIERGFQSQKDRIVLEGVIAMFKRIELEIVAEGVESELQLQGLRDMGCDYLQGYWISRALPAKAFMSFIEKGHIR